METIRGVHKKTSKIFSRLVDCFLFDKVKPDEVRQVGECGRLPPGQKSGRPLMMMKLCGRTITVYQNKGWI